MNLTELGRQMRATALKSPQSIKKLENLPPPPGDCVQLLTIKGRDYDVLLTLNAFEEIPFWRLGVQDKALEGPPPKEIVGMILSAFFADNKDIIEITALLPPEENRLCRQFFKHYEGSIFGLTFGQSPPNINDLAPGDQMRDKGEQCQTCFTAMVRFLRNPLERPQMVFPKMPGDFKPHPPINDLAALFHDLVGSRVCPVALAEVVKTLSFWAEIKSDPLQKLAVIMAPVNFLDLVEDDLHMQLGAIVFCASKARDFWNDKFGPGQNEALQKRALAYESEFLHSIPKDVFTPNAYQKNVMELFPQGLQSLPPALRYESLPFDIGRAKSEFKDITSGEL